MYEQAFNLNARPFTSMHYVKHYFPARAISESLQTCQLTIGRGSGPVVVIGDHGTGKTLLLAMLEEMFSEQLHVISLSADTIRSREDFLQNMLYQLQLNHRGLGENEMRLDITDSLKKGRVGGVLLLVDNAQKMTPDAFEEIQPLLDFVHQGQPQVRLVLAGSQGVEDRLADNRLVTFNQRIASRCFLSNLGSEETQAYVRAHLVRAGGDPDALFAPEAWRAIYEVTEGRPRFINQVCDHAMIFSATQGVIPISDSLIREAWFDIQRLPGTVAPTGSGASMSSTPVFSERIVSGEEGDEEWTVLEFGELAGESETAETASAETAPAETASVSPEQFASDAPVVDAPQLESLTAPEERSDTNSSIDPQGNADDRNNAAIIAAAMAGLGLAGTAASPPASDSSEAETLAAVSGTSSVSGETESFVETANDPFNTYNFDNEEVLTDAYSPFVAEQNQRSLDVTSEQLKDLTPTDPPQQFSGAADAATLASESDSAVAPAESFPTFETAMQSEPVREPVAVTVEPRELPPTRVESDAMGPISLSEEFSVEPAAATGQQEELETLAGSGYVPLDPDALQAAPQPTSYPETPVAPTIPVATQQDGGIRRQAEEIIQSLQNAENIVSQQDRSIQYETNAIETTIDQSLAAGDPAIPNQPAPQVVMPIEITPTAPATPALANVDPDPVEPERRILEDIREQVAFASTSAAPPQPLAETPPQQGEDQTVPPQQDDRDILSVSPQQHASPAPAPAELPAWTEQEPSSGEANRVDYQKLFDQLRNHQGKG